MFSMVRTFLTIVFIMVGVVGPWLSPGRAASQEKPLVKVYNDESRSFQLTAGQFLWRAVPEIRKRGFHVTRCLDTVEYERLKEHDVMVLWASDGDELRCEAQELAAVRRFVEEGGGVLLMALPGTLVQGAGAARKKPSRGAATPVTLPSTQFASTQIAGLFGVAFSNSVRQGVPAFDAAHALHQGIALQPVSVAQPLSVLKCSSAGAESLVRAFGQPAVVCGSFGKGRFLVCGSRRLLLGPDRLAERAGPPGPDIEPKKQLLDSWLRWLSARSPMLGKDSPERTPRVVLPRMKVETESIVVYCIPQLKKEVDGVVSDWQRVWQDIAAYAGISSPLEFVRDAERGEKLTVVLRGASAGGLSIGKEIHVTVLGPRWKITATLAHEVGHKILYGPTFGMREGFANWFRNRGLKTLGYEDDLRSVMRESDATFRKVDPTGTKLDLADPDMDNRHAAACSAKWLWILSELERKYGEDFTRRYVAALRKSYGSGIDKQVAGKRVRLSVEDIVRRMSEAAGEDLDPWFRSLGITPRRDAGAEPASEPSETLLHDVTRPLSKSVARPAHDRWTAWESWKWTCTPVHTQSS